MSERHFDSLEELERYLAMVVLASPEIVAAAMEGVTGKMVELIDADKIQYKKEITDEWADRKAYLSGKRAPKRDYNIPNFGVVPSATDDMYHHLLFSGAIRDDISFSATEECDFGDRVYATISGETFTYHKYLNKPWWITSADAYDLVKWTSKSELLEDDAFFVEDVGEYNKAAADATRLFLGDL